jgi:CheY-like chemotaxis protein
LQNAAEILKTTTAGNPLAEQTVRMIDRQLEHLGRLVDDLIDVSRITRDKIELRNERIDLATIIQEAYDAFLPQARQAGQFMRLALPGAPVSVNGDAVRLAQMLSNLLNNACKYMEAGGTISLSLERVDNEAIVRVRDTGAGIPPDQLSAIFDIFTQVDTTRERSQGGLGIGLTLVKRLAQMHGGDITAHSDGLGQGSEFVLRLPVLPGVTVPAAAEHKAVEAAGPGRRILVVDDNRDAASSLAMLLDVLGHTTRVAHDGLEAVHTAEEFSPDVIFLDIGLPGMNGYDVCRCIRRKMPGHKMFIAALTGWGQEDDRAKSRDAGFDTHVVKPIDGRTLTGLLAKLG